ncbi:MAG TPA: GIY-YIG nuclease family protein, partial [Planctomycetia bacterium]|nr:GIY-YIG nuclease family protein [Planctomycetia bacterium]
MRALFTANPTFGPGALSEPETPPTNIVRASSEKRIREKLKSELPLRPGVYGMLDKHGNWIYVGKSKSLRSRVLSYFRPTSRAAKERRILDRTVAFGWEPAPSEFASLLRELELIQRFRPWFNVRGQPGSREHSFLCIGKSPAPHVYLARNPGTECIAWYGPVPNGTRAEEAARRLNDAFGLRDCPRPVKMRFADQAELFPLLTTPACLRYDLGTCLGPCAGKTSEVAYAAKIRGVRNFLSGADSSLVDRLNADLEAAVRALEFERAAATLP